MNTTYDPSVIRKFADKLYRTADSVVILSALLGAVLGFALGWGVSQGSLILGPIGAAVLGGIGYALGSQRAQALRLQAQLALCQVQIEENSRSKTAVLG